MISEWKIANFKSLKDETNLRLAPLTLLAGTNSSGKSSLIQSMLLIAQTMASKIPSRSVVLNGTLTRLGQFDDLKSNNSESDSISISCQCTVQETPSLRSSMTNRMLSHRYDRLETASFSIEFGIDRTQAEDEKLQIHPTVFSSEVRCSLMDRNKQMHQRSFIAKSSKMNRSKLDELPNQRDEHAPEQKPDQVAYQIELDPDSQQQLSSQRHSQIVVTGCTFDHFLPRTIEGEINQLDERACEIVEEIQHFVPRHTRRTLNHFLPFRIERETFEISDQIFNERNLSESEEYKLAKTTFEERFAKMPRRQAYTNRSSTFLSEEEQERILPMMDVLSEIEDLKEDVTKKLVERENSYSELETDSFVVPYEISSTVVYFDTFFSSKLKYLGPLRVEPKPIYPLPSTADPYDVGLTGEYTATVLELHKSSHVEYVKFEKFDSPIENLKKIKTTLQDAVSYWLDYMGVASELETEDKGKLGFELRVKTLHSKTTHDLTHVGVGVSQVLPILVMCLLADNDSTLLFEQPELHLHPSVQARLGDFFISMILSGKQCIVETHSEYLVDRIRLRIALAESTDLSIKIKVLFAEKLAEKSEFREIVINEFGSIDQWPDGFFDESQRHAEELLLAAMEKRERQTTGKS